jgi:hypothetical protein
MQTGSPLWSASECATKYADAGDRVLEPKEPPDLRQCRSRPPTPHSVWARHRFVDPRQCRLNRGEGGGGDGDGDHETNMDTGRNARYPRAYRQARPRLDEERPLLRLSAAAMVLSGSADGDADHAATLF